MKTSRLEAFSDAVLAIIITIMILELKIPESPDMHEMKRLLPAFVSYVLSFIYVGIYWNNHHHLMHGADKLNGGILWANLHLLFWLSLIPFVTGWMGETDFEKLPVRLYGVVLLMAALAYWILQDRMVVHNGRDSKLAKALGKDLKGKISSVLYVLAIISSFWSEWIAGAFYIIVAFIWLVPDRRIEHEIEEAD